MDLVARTGSTIVGVQAHERTKPGGRELKLRPIIFALAAATFGLHFAASASATVTSTFDSGLDGWTVSDITGTTSASTDPNNPPTFNASGGDPGGYISTPDSEGTVAFLAPSAYVADLSSSMGGNLSFSLFDADGNDGLNYPAVVIYGDGTSIGYNAAPPATNFTNYSIPLTSAGWTVYAGDGNVGSTAVTPAEFSAVLDSATNVAILADWHSGGDATGLDTVTLSPASSISAAPEPSTWLLLFAGIGGIGLMLRRAKKTMGFWFHDALSV